MTLNTVFASVVLLANVECSTAAFAYEPTKDFSKFWQEVRSAFLEADPKAVAALSNTGKFPIRYGYLDMADACQQKVAKAYLVALHGTVANFRRGTKWRDFLEDTAELDLASDSAVSVNAFGEYSVHLKVLFAENGPDSTWQILEVRHDLDEVFEFAAEANGPLSCG